jgi:hypothetical protein
MKNGELFVYNNTVFQFVRETTPNHSLVKNVSTQQETVLHTDLIKDIALNPLSYNDRNASNYLKIITVADEENKKLYQYTLPSAYPDGLTKEQYEKSMEVKVSIFEKMQYFIINNYNTALDVVSIFIPQVQVLKKVIALSNPKQEQIKEIIMTSNLKDILTSIFGVLQLIVVIVNEALKAGEVNWISVIISVVVAVVAYFTGKKPDGTAKVQEQIIASNTAS